MTLHQRQPREEDPAYLAYVRTLPCLVCGRRPCDAAHIRSAAPQYGKRHTGMAEKPDDRWTLPLCRQHHAEQHSTNELAWWAAQDIDPFALAAALYESHPGMARRPARRIVKRKPTGRSIPQRADHEWPKKPLRSRPMRAERG